MGQTIENVNNSFSYMKKNSTMNKRYEKFKHRAFIPNCKEKWNFFKNIHDFLSLKKKKKDWGAKAHTSSMIWLH